MKGKQDNIIRVIIFSQVTITFKLTKGKSFRFNAKTLFVLFKTYTNKCFSMHSKNYDFDVCLQ